MHCKVFSWNFEDFLGKCTERHGTYFFALYRGNSASVKKNGDSWKNQDVIIVVLRGEKK